MPAILTIDEADFQAACPGLVDRLDEDGLDRIEMTRAGRVVAVVTPPAGTAPSAGVPDIYGFMRGLVIIPSGFDLTSPVLETFLAEEQDNFES
jgi:hypothetical protein